LISLYLQILRMNCLMKCVLILSCKWSSCRPSGALCTVTDCSWKEKEDKGIDATRAPSVYEVSAAPSASPTSSTSNPGTPSSHRLVTIHGNTQN
jgi:hypothetical protein